MLPTPEQRQEIKDIADSDRRARDEEARREAEAERRRESIIRQEKIDTLVRRCDKRVREAIGQGRPEVVVHVGKESLEWSDECHDIATAAVQKLTTPGYTFEHTIDRVERRLHLEDGDPSHPYEYSFFPAIKITWDTQCSD